MGIPALWFSNPSAVAPFLWLEILAVVRKSELHTITVTILDVVWRSRSCTGVKDFCRCAVLAANSFAVVAPLQKLLAGAQHYCDGFLPLL